MTRKYIRILLNLLAYFSQIKSRFFFPVILLSCPIVLVCNHDKQSDKEQLGERLLQLPLSADSSSLREITAGIQAGAEADARTDRYLLRHLTQLRLPCPGMVLPRVDGAQAKQLFTDMAIDQFDLDNSPADTPSPKVTLDCDKLTIKLTSASIEPVMGFMRLCHTQVYMSVFLFRTLLSYCPQSRFSSVRQKDNYNYLQGSCRYEARGYILNMLAITSRQTLLQGIRKPKDLLSKSGLVGQVK